MRLPLKSLLLNISIARAADSEFSYVTVQSPVGIFCLSMNTKMRWTPENSHFGDFSFNYL